MEIGDVAWLQLNLTGYEDTTMRVLWGLFHAGAGAALIRDTTQRGSVRRGSRFQAEFWLLNRGQVRQMASTGPMRGIARRYACLSR